MYVYTYVCIYICIYIFRIKFTEAILSNSRRKLLWFEITEMLIAVLRSKFTVLFIIMFGTLSFPVVGGRAFPVAGPTIWNSQRL